MIGVILAAGMGTRLMPLTKDIPKALLKINEVTLLERMINLALKRHRQSEKINYTFDTNILSMGGSFGAKGSKR